jgi:hypothetical protein
MRDGQTGEPSACGQYEGHAGGHLSPRAYERKLARAAARSAVRLSRDSICLRRGCEQTAPAGSALCPCCSRDAGSKAIRKRRAADPEWHRQRDYRIYLWAMIRGAAVPVSMFRPALLRHEGAGCPLCRQPLSNVKGAGGNHVDHDHGCQRHSHQSAAGSNSYGCRRCVRGLVHSRCNRAVWAYETHGTVPEGFTADQFADYVKRRPMLDRAEQAVERKAAKAA